MSERIPLDKLKADYQTWRLQKLEEVLISALHNINQEYTKICEIKEVPGELSNVKKVTVVWKTLDHPFIVVNPITARYTQDWDRPDGKF